MASDNILEIDEVLDESRKIRPRFHGQDGSGRVPHGRYKVPRENGQPLLEITYDQGVVHGPYLEFWSNGRVATEGQFHEGMQEGIWHFYHKDGTFSEIIHFKQGKEMRQEGRTFR